MLLPHDLEHAPGAGFQGGIAVEPVGIDETEVTLRVTAILVGDVDFAGGHIGVGGVQGFLVAFLDEAIGAIRMIRLGEGAYLSTMNL